LTTSATELGALNGGALTLAPDFSVAPAGAEILVVTQEPRFVRALGDMLGEQAVVLPVASMALALARMGASRRAHVLAVDTRGISDLRNALGRTYARAATTVVLLFGEQDAEESLHRAFKDSRVFAMLPFPLDVQRTSLALCEALASAVARNSAPL
jgi:DNA-binding NtrC family response regulator